MAVLFTSLSALVPVKVAAAGRKDFRGIKIVIDPGHGGHDGGAVAPNGLKEKNVNLSVAKHLANYLYNAGAKVSLTRASDRFVSLPGRAAIANKLKANRFVAVHQNSASNPNANGTETYYFHSSAARMSKLVQNELLKYLGHSNRGSRKARLAVIRRSNMPGILTEASFMSNRKEAQKLKSQNYRKKQALAIYKGLKREFGIKDPKPRPKPVAVVAPKPEGIVKPIIKKKTEVTGPTKLEVQYPSKFGTVRSEEVESQIHIPYISSSDDLVSIKNVGNNHAAPKIVFTDLLGNKTSEIKPFIEKKDSYDFKPKNIGGTNIGSINIIESNKKITKKITTKNVSNNVAGLSAGVVE